MYDKIRLVAQCLILAIGVVVSSAVIASAAPLLNAAGPVDVVPFKDEFHEWGELKVAGYGSNGKADGRWRVTDSNLGARAFNDGRVMYQNADNHAIYIEQQTLVTAGPCTGPNYVICSQSYYKFATVETPRVRQQGIWVEAKSSTALTGAAKYARGALKVCLDIPLRWDPCSGTVLTNGTQY